MNDEPREIGINDVVEAQGLATSAVIKQWKIAEERVAGLEARNRELTDALELLIEDGERFGTLGLDVARAQTVLDAQADTP